VFETVNWKLGSTAYEVTPAATPGLLNYLRSAAHRTAHIASNCTGTRILAESGLLDGRRATIHWQFAREMQRDYPKITVEEDRIFTIDGPIWTSAVMERRDRSCAGAPRKNGFGNRERMRRSFVRALGQSPQQFNHCKRLTQLFGD
jgi:transcriptional regulator GlxA family with amidase domain